MCMLSVYKLPQCSQLRTADAVAFAQQIWRFQLVPAALHLPNPAITILTQVQSVVTRLPSTSTLSTHAKANTRQTDVHS